MRRGARVRLNLGCGDDARPGFLNVDPRGQGADVRMDAAALAVRTGSVARLEALHLVEHLGFVGTAFALSEWRRVLAPGGVLVIETPDVVTTARRFAAGGWAERARLANWLYGLESPGQGHRFGFEATLLAALLADAGFGGVRRAPPTCHLAFPGLRLEARRRSDRGADARAAFDRRARASGLVPDDQAIAVEHLALVSAAVARAFARRGAGPRSALLAALAVRDPRLARVALELGGLPGAAARRWRELLGGPALARLPERLAGALAAAPPAAGTMAAAYTALAARAAAAVLAAARGRGAATLPAAGPEEEVRPFSPASLCRASSAHLGRGLRAWARGDRAAADAAFRRAAALNADGPTAFWNRARLSLANGDRAGARAALEEAIAAARAARAPALPLLLDELARLRSGRRVRAEPVSPSRPGPGTLA